MKLSLLVKIIGILLIIMALGSILVYPDKWYASGAYSLVGVIWFLVGVKLDRGDRVVDQQQARDRPRMLLIRRQRECIQAADKALRDGLLTYGEWDDMRRPAEEVVSQTYAEMMAEHKHTYG